MTDLTPDEEVHVLALRLVVLCRALIPPASPPEENAVLTHILTEIKTMSDNVNTRFDEQDARIDQLVAAETALEDRISQQDAKLTAAQSERDAAVADLTTTRATLADVQAQLAAMPQFDTAAIEARIQGETAKLDVVIDRLNAIDAAPVPPAPEPTPEPAPEPTPDAGSGDGSTPAEPEPEPNA